MNEFIVKTVPELQVELGGRLRRLRIRRNLDQREAAAKAGISEKALRNLEAGKGSTLETLLRVMKGLNALDGLQYFAPESSVDPLAMLRQSPARQRVSKPRRAASTEMT